MEKIILRTNAIPVYGFLSVINARHPQEGPSQPKILDCGAGGPIPPLALFAQHGFEAWGIDVSDEKLGKARQFCEQHGIEVQLRSGDMRDIPFEDETFDGEYWGEEGGERSSHSLFSDQEMDDLLSAWEIVFKEKHVSYHWGGTEKPSLAAWMDSYEEAGGGYSREAWRARYESRGSEFQYAHLYFFLRKP